jgi:site-specific DNA-adenine methylase
MYPLFTSTQKEIDLNSLVPFIDGNQYDSFVDVLFTTGNLFFFINLPKNLINIPNLPSYCFYKVLKRGEGVKIEQYVNDPVNTFNKSSYENMKENIKVLLKKYEQNYNDPTLELSIATLFYCLTKGTPKQMLKYRGDEVISTFNTYNSDIQTFNLGNFHLNNLLNKTDILYTDEFYNIISQNNKPDTIIFIDLL